jgi:hypothetical protein
MSANRIGSELAGRASKSTRMIRWANQQFRCPAPFTKIFLFSFDPNHRLILCRPVPNEGRLAIVTNAGRDAVDATALLTNSANADGEVVWFRRPDAGVKSGGLIPARRRWQESRSPRRARRKPLKPLRREGRTASAEPVCSCAPFSLPLHARPRVQRAPGLPCALSFQRAGRCWQNSREMRGEIVKVCLDLSTSLRAKQSNSSL